MWSSRRRDENRQRGLLQVRQPDRRHDAQKSAYDWGFCIWGCKELFRICCQSCGQNYEIQMTLVKTQPASHSDNSNSCTEKDKRQAQLAVLIEERENLQRESARYRPPFCLKRRKEVEFQLSLLQRKINIRKKP